MWLCLAWGIACSPKPAADANNSGNEIKSHETSTNRNQTAQDAGATLDSGVSDAGVVITADAQTIGDPDASSDAASTMLLEAGSTGLMDVDAESRVSREDASSYEAGPTPPFDAAGTIDAGSDANVGVDAAPDAQVCNVPEITGSECELSSNCGCEGGTVCRVADLHTGQTLCFPPGETPSYSPCELDQDCAAGQICEAGLCRPVCDEVGSFCEDGSSCATFSEGGRSVCAGHCNVLTRSPDIWSNAERWVEVMTRQQERGLRDEYWTAEYSNCGEGAYCHPGVGPDEASSPSPLYPHCTVAKRYEVDNSYCNQHEDCVSGLACGVYPGEIQGRCIRIGFVESDCRDTGHGVQRGTNVGGDTLIAPDGINTLGLCTKSVP